MSPTSRKLAVRKTAASKTAGTKQASTVTRNSSPKKAATALEPQRANGPHSNSQNADVIAEGPRKRGRPRKAERPAVNKNGVKEMNNMEAEPTTTKARGRRAADEDLTYQYEEPYTNRVGTSDPWDFDNPLLAANYADNSDQEYRCDSSVVSYMRFMENLEREKEEQQAPKETRSTLVVLVNNGWVLHKMNVKPQHSIIDVHQNVASILQCYPTSVTLGYTGPWFKKIETKIQPWYLKSDVDLDELVQVFKKYLEELKKKHKVDSAGKIVLMNMNDERKGSKRSGSVLQNATKPTSAAEATKGDLNAMLAPHIKEIKQNLWCSVHLEEVCYVRADGTHIYYTMKNYFDHVRLLLSKAPGVTASEVPRQLNLLDYHKSKQTVQTTLGSTAIGMQQGLTNQAGAGQAQADGDLQIKPGVENSSAGRTRHASPSSASWPAQDRPRDNRKYRRSSRGRKRHRGRSRSIRKRDHTRCFQSSSSSG
ncbi:hypothetical protein ACEPAI_3991 [Sanghuangporus weigelae]